MAREFDLIDKYFRPIAGQGALNLQDDAAVFLPPQGREMVVTTDAIVASVHFRAQDPPDLVARKLLRVNLSDLAAMGAVPFGYVITVSVPRNIPESWFASFAAGLAEDTTAYHLQLLGGDTTSTPGPISLTATLFGHVAAGAALRRNGAQPGDLLCVTGTIGDGALGLLALRGEIPDPTGHLANRYLLPRPRLGVARAGQVHACMDISDGLVQDCGHIARASGLAVEIDAACVPLSPAARALGPALLERCLTGGDDYELLMAVPAAMGPPEGATAIGRFTPGAPGVRVLLADGETLRLATTGYSHF